MISINFCETSANNIATLLHAYGLVIVKNAVFKSPSELANYFSNLDLHTVKTYSIHNNVQELSPTSYLGQEEWAWHNDRCYLEAGCVGTILYNKKNGHLSPTCFVNNTTLPQNIVNYYRGTTSTFGHNAAINNQLDNSEISKLEQKLITKPSVHKHPITDQDTVYLSPFNNKSVDTTLFTDYADLHCYKHDWSPNDMLIWDNTTMTHKRFFYTGERVMWRMQFKISE